MRLAEPMRYGAFRKLRQNGPDRYRVVHVLTVDALPACGDRKRNMSGQRTAHRPDVLNSVRFLHDPCGACLALLQRQGRNP
jgi:hypothetical protein